MKMNYKTILISSILLLTGLSAGPGIAQTRVVVIPIQGDHIDIFRGTLITGNTRCSYDDGSQWSFEDCNTPVVAIAGQDAESQNGVEVTIPPRFVIDKGTVEDRLTGLIWLRNGDCYAQAADWSTALQAIIQLNNNGSMDGVKACGDTSGAGNSHQTDWRLPNVRELQTLTFYGDHGPPYLVNSNGDGQWMEADPFQSVQVTAEAYWSSTTIAQRTADDANPDGDDTLNDAMRVNYFDGTTDGTSKGAMQHVWAVRDKE